MTLRFFKDTRMPSVQQLMSRTGSLLRVYPILWTAPLGLALLMALVNPAGPKAGSLLVVVIGLINLAVTLGWLAQIGRADQDARPTWDDFFTAIGRCFGSMVIGSLMMFGLVLLVALPILLLGYDWAGPKVLAELIKQAPDLARRLQHDPLALSALDPTQLQALLRMLIAMLGAATWYAALSLALLYWNQSLVLGQRRWLAAWKDSVAVIREHFGLTMGLVSLQTLGYVVGMLAGIAPGPFDVLGWLIMFFCQVFFPVAFTLLYRRARPEAALS